MKSVNLYLLIFLLLVTSCNQDDTGDIDKVESECQDKVSRLIKSNDKLHAKIDDYKKQIDSLNKLNQIQIVDDVILVIGSWVEGDNRFIKSAFVFYQTIDSIYIPSYHSFPNQDLFNTLLRNKRFINVYSGGKKVGLLEFQDYGIDFQEIRLKEQILPPTLNMGYNDGSRKLVHKYNAIGTTNSISNLDVMSSYPTKDNFKLFVEEASKEYKSIVDRSYNTDSIKIEKLDILNSPAISESTIIGSCSLTFEYEKNKKIDMYHLFMIIDIDNNNKIKVGYIYSTHTTSFYEGYGGTKYFIDIYDIDSDGVYEIFVVATGYEQESVFVLKKTDRKWIEFNEVQSYYGG